MPCPICGAQGVEARFRLAFPERSFDGRHAWPLREKPDVPHWTVAACRSCGVHFADPMPSDDEIVRFYREQVEPNEWEMEHYVHVRPEEVAAWSAFAERLTRLNGRPGRMLEVGCAAGHLLSGAIEHGWDVMGVEASPKFSTEVKRRGLPVHDGVLATLPEGQGLYDLVVMTDVLEHLRDPVADLARCRDLLKPGGLLVIATCDIGSLAARYYGLRWRQLVISHTYYWTNASLRIALDRAGLDTVALSSMRYWDPDPTLQRRRWVREFTKMFGRKVLQIAWMPLAGRSTKLRDAHGKLTNGRLDFGRLQHKVGNQASMADVVLIVGRHRM